MNEYIIIQTTTDNSEWMDNLIRALLENHLSADVQLSEIKSHYWWKGEVRNKAETLLTIKTKQSLFGAVESAIREHSLYEIPQIIMTPIVGGGTDYLNWIGVETKN